MTPAAPARTPMHAAALRLAARGFRVFPLIPGTSDPAIERWPDLATTDAATIGYWWGTMWPDANVGIECSGLLVVDVDQKNGKPGPESLDMLRLTHGDLPVTYTQHTPSGGQHIVLRLPAGTAARNSVSKIGPGLDVRTARGFIVGAGSTKGGKLYAADNPDAPIADAPDWLVDLCRAAAPPSAANRNTPAVELDLRANVQRAIAYLDQREPAVEGAGGDHHTFATACGVRDLGVSEPVALELMLDHFNPRCSPPWDPEAMQAKVHNAYRYAQSAVGSKTAAVDFPAEKKEGPTTPPSGTAAPDIFAVPDPARPFAPDEFTPVDPAAIKPRRWVLGHSVLGGSPGGISAPGGSNKTTLLLQRAVAVAANREDITGEKVWTPGPVWYVNLEEDRDEILRRIAAICLEFGVPQSSLQGRLLIGAGADSITLAKLKDGMAVATVDADRMIATAKARGIVMIGIDPLVQFHAVSENANEQMAVVVRRLALVAERSGAAVVFAAHSRKGASAGDSDSTRGASAIRDGVRIVETLAVMTPEEADKYGVGEGGRRSFVRLDNAKANYAAPGDEVRWFQRVSVSLDNADGVRPADSIGVLRPFDMRAQAESAATARAAAEDPERLALAQVLCAAMASDRCALARLIGVAADHTRLKDRGARNAIAAAVPEAPAYRLVEHDGRKFRMSLRPVDPEHRSRGLDVCREPHDGNSGNS